MEGLTPTPASSISGKETRYLFYRRLGGPPRPVSAGKKNLAFIGIDPQTAQSVASRYTDGIILAPVITFIFLLHPLTQGYSVS
jgi:hypothetical protein